jgi:hypothetical protein
MKTPKEFTKNIKNGIITKEMFAMALYSVNKRAKNCRDKIRELKHTDYRFSFFDYGEMSRKQYEEKMNEYYSIKDKLLSFIKPNCIHKELNHYEKTRIYDYEKEYENVFEEYDEDDIVWQNCYYDHEEEREVWFVDVIDRDCPVYFYYLFYDLGDFSFHTPIEDIKENNELEIIEIDELYTEGKEITDLLSVSFVKKILDMLENNVKIIE